MSLLYGRNFPRAVEFNIMSGWDTDCNAGNVETIMGVALWLGRHSAALPRADTIP